MAGLFISTSNITKGSLISFHYPVSMAREPNMIHDPYPMLIISDITPKYVLGVNLHYLTYRYIQTILQNNVGNASFSYSTNIKPDPYMSKAFRSYVRVGMSSIKSLDKKRLFDILKTVKSFGTNDVEEIRAKIQQQIQNRLQVKADELGSYETWRMTQGTNPPPEI